MNELNPDFRLISYWKYTPASGSFHIGQGSESTFKLLWNIVYARDFPLVIGAPIAGLNRMRSISKYSTINYNKGYKMTTATEASVAWTRIIALVRPQAQFPGAKVIESQ